MNRFRLSNHRNCIRKKIPFPIIDLKFINDEKKILISQTIQKKLTKWIQKLTKKNLTRTMLSFGKILLSSFSHRWWSVSARWSGLFLEQELNKPTEKKSIGNQLTVTILCFVCFSRNHHIRPSTIQYYFWTRKKREKKIYSYSEVDLYIIERNLMLIKYQKHLRRNKKQNNSVLFLFLKHHLQVISTIFDNKEKPHTQREEFKSKKNNRWTECFEIPKFLKVIYSK